MWKKDQDRQTPAYTLEDMHRDIAESVAKAKAARVHSVLIERALKSAVDSFAQIRAMTEAVNKMERRIGLIRKMGRGPPNWIPQSLREAR